MFVLPMGTHAIAVPIFGSNNEIIPIRIMLDDRDTSTQGL